MILRTLFQVTAIIFLGAMTIVKCDCEKKHQVTSTSGKIASASFDLNCDHVWTFQNSPNNTTMLVLRVVEPPVLIDVIKLNGEDFIDDSNFKYCRILETSSRTIEDSLSTLQRIHEDYPNCKLRSGVKPGVTLSYEAPDNSFSIGINNFVIEYSSVQAYPGPSVDPITVASTSSDVDEYQSTSPTKSMTETTVKDGSEGQSSTQRSVTTQTTGKATARDGGTGGNVLTTSQMATIFGILGGIILILLLIVLFVLIRRIKRKKLNVTKDNMQLNNFYQAVPDASSSAETTVQIYTEIETSNTTTPGGETDIRRNTEHRESARDVINPLYGDQRGDKHSYEYIEVGYRQGSK